MAVGGELILGPLLVAAGVLTGLAIGADTVNHLEPVTVTARMDEKGLSSHVMTERLVTRIAQVADLDTEFHEVGAKDIAGKGFIEILAEAVHLDEVVLAARKLPGAVDAEFNPQFVEREGQTILHLQIVRPQTGVRMVQEFEVEGDRIDPALRQAARLILGVVDPIALVMDDMRQGDLAGARLSLQRAERVIDDGRWHITDTLRGLVLLKEDDPPGAIEALRLALLREPDFAPARLTLAIAVARAGRPHEAGEILAELPERGATWSKRARVEVPATAAFLRGRFFAAHGHWAEALNEHREAVARVPNFSEAHQGLAEVYQALHMAPLAEYHEQIAVRLMAPDVPRFDDRLDGFLQLVVAATKPPGQPAPPPGAAESAAWTRL